MMQVTPPSWRASDVYVPANASKAGLLDETRLFLVTYAHVGSLPEARQILINQALPQRGRETRATIVQRIQMRLTRWSPPAWVLGNLCTFAEDVTQPSLAAALLLHVVRQDALLTDVVHHLVVPRWTSGEHRLIRADVQRLLDRAVPDHPEVLHWSHATREKLAGNVLSILRDYGLLRGREHKQIVEPLVPLTVAEHLVRLLRAEGVPEEALAAHPDWRIWLWTPQRAQVVVDALAAREAPA